ncbi:MAG: P-loop NTPase fold protein [Rheinheimera sp.]|nr:P-loop NTPase fold protein [Rheinheimera sp.]
MTETYLDLFERQHFAKQLLDDLACFKTPFSVGLDARWGNGKTFFVDSFLQEECSKRKIPLIKYDCFEHEREQDPFISLTKVILDSAQLLVSESDEKEKSDKFSDACLKTKSFAVGLLKTTGKALLKHTLGQTLIEIGENCDYAPPDELANDLVTYVEEKLKPAQQLKDLRDDFYTSMQQLIEVISETKSILVVIDELDRCRPDHAVSVLESIKHLMSVPGVYFVFTYHREQLCSALKHIYGAGLDANLYLQKFVDLDIPLPGAEFQGISKNLNFFSSNT